MTEAVPPVEIEEEENYCAEHDQHACGHCGRFHCDEGDPCDMANPYLRYSR